MYHYDYLKCLRWMVLEHSMETLSKENKQKRGFL